MAWKCGTWKVEHGNAPCNLHNMYATCGTYAWQLKLGKMLLFKGLFEQKRDLNQRLQHNVCKLTPEEQDAVRLEQSRIKMLHIQKKFWASETCLDVQKMFCRW